MNRRFLGICFLLVAHVGLNTAWAQGTLSTLPSVPGVRFEQKLGSLISTQSEVIDETGRSLPLQQLIGSKPKILVFAYYRCPNLCTLVLNGLAQAIREIPEKLGKDYEVLTVSIDPAEKSSLALMKQRTYLARYGETQNTGWHFLTAHESSIQQLTDSAGFHFQRDPMTGEYMHPSGIIVLSPSGKISQYFFGIQFDPTKLHLALQKARAGKLGSWIDDILLYCFHYRPRDTKIGQQVMLTIRIAAGLGALMLCAFLAYLALSQQKMIERRAPQRGIKK